MPRFTENTLKVWNALSRISEETDFPPTIREIGDRCGGMSSSLVVRHLDKLEQADCVERIPRISRGIRLLRKSEER